MTNKRIYDLTEDTTPSAGDYLVIDKSGLTEATKVDVNKFVVAIGLSGGQTLYGGTAANEDLILHGTSNSTRTTSYVILQPTAGNVGIGTTAPSYRFHVSNTQVNTTGTDVSAYVISNYVPADTPTTSTNYGLQVIESYTHADYLPTPLVGISGDVRSSDNKPIQSIGVLGAASYSGTDAVVQGSLYGGFFYSANGAGTISHLIGIKLNRQSNAGTVSQAFSLYIADAIPSGVGTITDGSAIHIEGAGDGNAISWSNGNGSTRSIKLYPTSNSNLHLVGSLDTTGAIGVGTATPDSVVHIVGTNAQAGGLTFESSAGTATDRMAMYASGNYGFLFKKLNASTTVSWTSSSDSIEMSLNSSADLGIGATPDSRLHVGKASTSTNAVQQLVTLSTNSTGTAAAGFGSRILWELESSTTDDQTAAIMDVVWAEATHATRKARAVLSVYDTAVRECVRLEASGTAAMIGFLGANASARLAHVADPAGGGTVDAEARSAINSILTTLETFGFHATS